MQNSFKDTLSKTNKKMEVKEVDSGHGIYAKEIIKKGELICIFGGYVMSIEEESNGDPAVSDYGLQIDEKNVLGIKSKDEIEISCFFNHSCEPNCGFRGQIFLIAMRDIEKGEQITFDYAMTLGDSADVEKYEIKCLCGEKNCRGTITDSDWKIPELQKKYSGYFQPYIEDRIKTFNLQ